MSGLRSAAPPNDAATRPDLVSAIVEARQEGKGAESKMNSDFSTGFGIVTVEQPVPRRAANNTVRTECRQVLDCAALRRFGAFVVRGKAPGDGAVQDAGALMESHSEPCRGCYGTFISLAPKNSIGRCRIRVTFFFFRSIRSLPSSPQCKHWNERVQACKALPSCSPEFQHATIKLCSLSWRHSLENRAIRRMMCGLN